MVTLLFVLGAVALFALTVWWLLPSVIGADPYSERTRSSSPVLALLSAVIGVIVLIAGFGWNEVGPGQVGVKVRFGQVQEGTIAPGLFWMMPFVEGLVIYDGRVQAYQFENIEGATRDLQPVNLSGLINYHIDATKADRILQEIGGPADYAAKVFLTPANTALKEVTPRYPASEVIAKRDEIGQATLAALRERMVQFHIVVDRVSVANVGLNPEFMASVESKQIAQQDLARAEFEAQRNARLAEGDAAARIARAQGEAEANRLLNASLTDQLLQWTAIQKLSDKVRLMLVPSEQGLIFDLGRPEEPS